MQRRGTPCRPPPTPLCLYYLRGRCHYGHACRFCHDAQGQEDAALPFDHRQYVRSEAAHAILTAALASTPRSSSLLPWRFRVMSYNVLADCLAREHAAELYTSAPRFALEWGFRGGLIIREILHHRPDVVCLQEVDHFRFLQQELQAHGYEGMHTKRTGDRRDGLAMFWRTDVMRPVKRQIIKYTQLDMKDNVAQLIVFRRWDSSGGSSSRRRGGSSRHDSDGGAEDSDTGLTASDISSDSLSGQKRRQQGGDQSATPKSRHVYFDSSSDQGSPRIAGEASRSMQVEEATEAADLDAWGEVAASLQTAPALVVANIHCLFNPKRGDIKVGQVRTLLEHVNSLCLQQQKRPDGGGLPAAVICGDFNSAAGCPIYQFVRSGKLDLSQCDRRRMSGQVESAGQSWRALQRSFLMQQQHQHQQQYHASNSMGSQLGDQSWPGSPPPLLLNAAAAALAGNGSGPQQAGATPPYAASQPAEEGWLAESGRLGSRSSSSMKGMRAWTAEDVRIAAGSRSSGSGGLTAYHPITVESAYRDVTGAEAPYSTCHDKFIGCVDYCFYSKGHLGSGAGDGDWRLLPVGVLQPPPLETLHSAQPSPAWPSDHISLVCDFALVNTGAHAAEAEAGASQLGEQRMQEPADL